MKQISDPIAEKKILYSSTNIANFFVRYKQAHCTALPTSISEPQSVDYTLLNSSKIYPKSIDNREKSIYELRGKHRFKSIHDPIRSEDPLIPRNSQDQAQSRSTDNPNKNLSTINHSRILSNTPDLSSKGSSNALSQQQGGNSLDASWDKKGDRLSPNQAKVGVARIPLSQAVGVQGSSGSVQKSHTEGKSPSPGRWTRFNRGDCPICSGARKDCRQSPKGLVHCRSGNDAPNGWRFVGEDSLAFGLYAEGDGHDRPIPTYHPKPVKRVTILSDQQRDRQFQQIAKHSGLSTAHRQLLANRGVDAATAQRWYDSGLAWSWSPGAQIPGVTTALPGVEPSGVLRTFKGMAIAIPSVTGQILGTQIKPNHGGGYFWVSSDSVGGNGPRLANGEMPIGVYGQHSTTLDFAEGFLKPAIAADRFGLCVVGAAGGNWAGSPEQLKAIIEATGARTFILNADGGAIVNPQVLRQYEKLSDLLQGWGYTLQVRWWGQSAKSDGDVDEIDLATFQQARVISWQEFKAPRATPNSFADLLRGVKHCLDRAADKVRRGFGYRTPKPTLKTKKVTTQPTAIEVNTDCVAIALWEPERRWWLWVTPETVPTFDEYIAMGSPQLLYERNHHNGVTQALLKAGHRHILQNGAGGMGKTHDAGEMGQQWHQIRSDIPGAEMGTLHFIGPNYRNPDTESVERIPERVSGAALDIDESKRTPLGNPHRRRHSGHDPASIPGLCSEDQIIQKLQSRGGILIERGYQSDYCQNVCGKAFDCPYLQAQQKQGQPAAVREDINGVRLTKTTPENRGHAGDILTVDEAERTINTIKTVWGSTTDISREIGNLAQQNIDLYQRFQPVIDAIAMGLRRVKEETEGNGLSHSDVAKFLPSREQLDDLFWECVFPQWCHADDIWGLDLDWLFTQLHFVNNPNQWRDHVAAAVENGFPISGKTLDEWISSEPLYRTYQAFYTGRVVDLRVDGNGTLIFSYDNAKIRKTLNNAHAIIPMDATPDIWALGRKFRVKQNHITRMMPLRPSYNNLTINVVRGIGKTGFGRAKLNRDGSLLRTGEYDIQPRIVKAVAAIAEQCDGITGLLDAKKFIPTYSQIPDLITGYCFNDNRGSNIFKYCDQMISVATPIANVGAKLSEYHLLTGRAEIEGGFWAWQRRSMTNELIQDIYRTRAQHRLDESINHWLFAELDDGQVEEVRRHFPNATIKFIDIMELCPEAAMKGVQTEHAVVRELWNQLREGGTPTTRSVGDGIERGRSRVSQISNDIHPNGFEGLKGVLILLLDTINSKINTPILDKEALQLAERFLPDIARQLQSGEVSPSEAAEYVAAIAETVGNRTFSASLAHTPPWAIATFITEFLPLLGDASMEWITRDFRERLGKCNLATIK